MALVETWLNDSVLDVELQLPAYNLYRRDRDRHGGAIAVYIDSFVLAKKVATPSGEELLCLQLVLKSKVLLLCVIYRPPGFDTNLCNLENSIASLNACNYDRVIVVGDFNVDVSDHQSDRAADLIFTMSGFRLRYSPTGPTRVSPNTSSTTDLTFVSSPDLPRITTLLASLSITKPPSQVT